MPPKRGLVIPVSPDDAEQKSTETFSNVAAVQPTTDPAVQPTPIVRAAASAMYPETTNLSDIPPVYLQDRSNWIDFKRALNECGMT